MNVTVTKQPKSSVKLTVELTAVEMQPHVQKAAEKLSKEHKIEGFRPGMASPGIVAQKIGAQALWEEAAEFAVRKSFVSAVMDNKVQTLGQPKISILKLAPDNDFSYTAEVATLPEVKLEGYKKFSANKMAVAVTPKQVDQALEDLRAMFATEALVERAAKAGDKVEIDVDVYLDRVLIEDGSSKQHPVVIGSNNFLPGFEDQLIGMTKGQPKEFSLPFPANYNNKQMAGKRGEFKVTVKDIYQIDKPELNDEFAKKAGKFQNLNELRGRLEKNLIEEGERREDLAYEKSLVDELIKRATFGELPDVLIESEQHKIMHELEDQVKQQGGLSFDDYLKGLKKTKDQLQAEIKPQAEQRVKAALIIRHIAKQENIDAEPADIEKEVQQTLKMYTSQPDLRDRIDSDDYRDYVRSLLINRQVIQQLKAWASAK